MSSRDAARDTARRTDATEPLPRQISRRLIRDIVSGHLGAGERIPTESELVREFGVSRSVVREGIKRVSALGLLDSQQGRQTRVAPYASWNHFAPEILAARRESGAVEDVLLELLELRRMIEIEAASLAAVRADRDDLDRMETAIEGLEATLDEPAAFARADLEFHNAILAATRNHLLPRLFDVLRPLLEFGREISVHTRPEGIRVSQGGHRAVLAAIRSGAAAKARREMEEHLGWTANLDFGNREVRLAMDRARGDEKARAGAGRRPGPQRRKVSRRARG
jgi:DNA-binding FadR family transcriptional regulator